MPHTSHRKKAPAHPRKRQLLDVGDGWTTVVPSSPSTPPRSSPSTTAFEPTAIPPGLTIERLNDEYLPYKKMWEESECCMEVVEVLKKMGGRVEGCVCLGLGSLTEGRSQRVGMLQLAVLETALRVISDLGSNPTDDIPICAQDPVFNTLDASFLSSRSITVLPSPAALSHLTPTTFLFAPHCERSFLLPGLEGKDPEIVICNDIGASVMGAMSGTVGEKEREVAAEFLRRRMGWRVPVWRGVEDVVNDLCIYFRERGEEVVI